MNILFGFILLFPAIITSIPVSDNLSANDGDPIKPLDATSFEFANMFEEHKGKVYAKNAVNAKSAGNAINTYSAMNAGNAKNARNAMNAYRSVNAGTAKFARNAINAYKAKNAINAEYAKHVVKEDSEIAMLLNGEAMNAVNEMSAQLETAEDIFESSMRHQETARVLEEHKKEILKALFAKKNVVITDRKGIIIKVEDGEIKIENDEEIEPSVECCKKDVINATAAKNAVNSYSAANAMNALDSANTFNALNAMNAKHSLCSESAKNAKYAKNANNAKYAYYAMHAKHVMEDLDLQLPEEMESIMAEEQ